MTMMFKIPSKKDECENNNAPLVAILKINEILKALTRKIPCRVGPWNISNLVYDDPKKDDLLTNLLDNIDFVESYVFHYNRFLAPGK